MYLSWLFFLLMRGANPSLEGIVHVSRPPMLKLPPTIPSVYYLARQETIYYEEGIVSLHLEFRSQENIVIPVVKFKASQFIIMIRVWWGSNRICSPIALTQQFYDMLVHLYIRYIINTYASAVQTTIHPTQSESISFSDSRWLKKYQSECDSMQSILFFVLFIAN